MYVNSVWLDFFLGRKTNSKRAPTHKHIHASMHTHTYTLSLLHTHSHSSFYFLFTDNIGNALERLKPEVKISIINVITFFLGHYTLYSF